jgi:hypothetical protein
MVFITTALRSTDCAVFGDKLDCAHPFKHFETKLVLHAEPQRRTV